MLPAEIIKKIKLIDIKTRLLVNEMFSGEYHSVFKGRGIEFSEVREYTYGDDIRTIDWNVTARFGRPFVKVFEEERELTVIILSDASASTLFGSTASLQRDVMIELAALFAFSAIENNDKVAAVLFSDVIEKYIPPKKEKIHALRLLRELLYIQPRRRKTDLKLAFDFINNTQRRKSIIFVFSDFIADGYEKSFKMMANRHDVIPVVFSDPFEKEVLNHRGLLIVDDMETGVKRIIDLADRKVREDYRRTRAAQTIIRKKLFMTTGIDFIEIINGEPYLKPLVEFFHKRAQRL